MIKLANIISEGISTKDGQVVFDIQNDNPNDQLKLFVNNKVNKFYSMPSQGMYKIFFAYMFTTYNVYFKNSGDKTSFTRDEWNDRVNFIRTELKGYSEPKTVSIVSDMIDKSLMRFDRIEKLSTYDVIVPLKSSSTLNDVIAERIRAKTGAKVLSNTIVKDTLKNVEISLPDTESSEKTKQYLDTIKKRFASMPDSEFKSKMIKASFRRYVSKFLKYKDNDTSDIYNKIKGKNVLLIDDTLGEGRTLIEMNRLIQQAEPASVSSYVFLKDY
jgi:hypothetical protein